MELTSCIRDQDVQPGMSSFSTIKHIDTSNQKNNDELSVDRCDDNDLLFNLPKVVKKKYFCKKTSGK